jgi:hypothetical protein
MPETYQGWSRAGAGNATAYMVSGRPWMSGSAITGSTGLGEVRFEFPTVTRAVTVVNKGGVALRVSFDSIENVNVTNYHHYTTLTNTDDSMGISTRLQYLYVSVVDATKTGMVEVFAELTDIPFTNDNLYVSGSGVNCSPV